MKTADTSKSGRRYRMYFAVVVILGATGAVWAARHESKDPPQVYGVPVVIAAHDIKKGETISRECLAAVSNDLGYPKLPARPLQLEQISPLNSFSAGPNEPEKPLHLGVAARNLHKGDAISNDDLTSTKLNVQP
jgi:flagella basal body P-ring formation protein FlgA